MKRTKDFILINDKFCYHVSETTLMYKVNFVFHKDSSMLFKKFANISKRYLDNNLNKQNHKFKKDHIALLEKQIVLFNINSKWYFRIDKDLEGRNINIIFNEKIINNKVYEKCIKKFSSYINEKYLFRPLNQEIIDNIYQETLYFCKDLSEKEKLYELYM